MRTKTTLSALLLGTLAFGDIMVPTHTLSFKVNGNTSIWNIEYKLLFSQDEKPAIVSSHINEPFSTVECEKSVGITKRTVKVNYYDNGYVAECFKDKCNVKISYLDISTLPSKNEYQKQLGNAYEHCENYAPIVAKTLQFDVMNGGVITKELDSQSTVTVSYSVN